MPRSLRNFLLSHLTNFSNVFEPFCFLGPSFSSVLPTVLLRSQEPNQASALALKKSGAEYTDSQDLLCPQYAEILPGPSLYLLPPWLPFSLIPHIQSISKSCHYSFKSYPESDPFSLFPPLTLGTSHHRLSHFLFLLPSTSFLLPLLSTFSLFSTQCKSS